MAANSNRGLSDRCSKEAEEATAIKLQSPFLSLCCEVCHANGGDRYFNRGKLDYPNQATSKASKKYVKAMKALKVCFRRRSIYFFASADIRERTSSHPQTISTNNSSICYKRSSCMTPKAG